MTGLIQILLDHFSPRVAQTLAQLCCIAVVSTLLIQYAKPARSCTSSSRSPPRFKLYDFPIFGAALSFRSVRHDMLMQGRRLFSDGRFSIQLGSNHMVNMNTKNTADRKTIFGNKGLTPAEAMIELVIGIQSEQNLGVDDAVVLGVVRDIHFLTRTERLLKLYTAFDDEVAAFCVSLRSRPATSTNEEWRVFDITETLPFLSYKLLHRSMGASEIATDDRLATSTIDSFDRLDQIMSVWRLVFPWMLTPSCIDKYVAGAKLYFSICSILNQRKKSGYFPDDGLTFAWNEYGNEVEAVKFIISIMSESVGTLGFTMTWPLTFLANSCEWQERCRDEVRAVLSKHGESPNQPTSDVFAKMSLQSWESEFPVLQACLQETLRIGLTGTYLRKNVSGKEIPIGDTGQVIPAGSYAVCLPEYVHLDPDIFPDPLTFNPARSYERVAQGGPGSTMLLTWGTGRHTCPGRRLASLFYNMVLAHLLAEFEFELSDRQGRCKVGSMPPIDRNLRRPEKPASSVYLRYKPAWS